MGELTIELKFRICAFYETYSNACFFLQCDSNTVVRFTIFIICVSFRIGYKNYVEGRKKFNIKKEL